MTKKNERQNYISTEDPARVLVCGGREEMCEIGEF